MQAAGFSETPSASARSASTFLPLFGKRSPGAGQFQHFAPVLFAAHVPRKVGALFGPANVLCNIIHLMTTGEGEGPTYMPDLQSSYLGATTDAPILVYSLRVTTIQPVRLAGGLEPRCVPQPRAIRVNYVAAQICLIGERFPRKRAVFLAHAEKSAAGQDHVFDLPGELVDHHVIHITQAFPVGVVDRCRHPFAKRSGDWSRRKRLPPAVYNRNGESL